MLQNGPKMTTNMSKPSQQDKLPACNIFELPHYFWNDPVDFMSNLPDTFAWFSVTHFGPGAWGSPGARYCYLKAMVLDWVSFCQFKGAGTLID